MCAKGIELYCATTVDDRDAWLPTITHIALEGRCFVLSACPFLKRSDLPAGYATKRFPASQDVLIWGESCIIGPLGQMPAGPKLGGEYDAARHTTFPPTNAAMTTIGADWQSDTRRNIPSG